MDSAQSPLPSAPASFGSCTEGQSAPTQVGASTVVESSMSTGVLSPLLQGYRSLVKHDARDEYDDIKHTEMRMDLEVILKRLPWQQRRLAKLLKTCTPLEAAEKLDVHPNSVYRMIEQMRECFKMHNFQNFL